MFKPRSWRWATSTVRAASGCSLGADWIRLMWLNLTQVVYSLNEKKKKNPHSRRRMRRWLWPSICTTTPPGVDQTALVRDFGPVVDLRIIVPFCINKINNRYRLKNNFFMSEIFSALPHQHYVLWQPQSDNYDDVIRRFPCSIHSLEDAFYLVISHNKQFSNIYFK